MGPVQGLGVQEWTGRRGGTGTLDRALLEKGMGWAAGFSLMWLGGSHSVTRFRAAVWRRGYSLGGCDYVRCRLANLMAKDCSSGCDDIWQVPGGRGIASVPVLALEFCC